MAKQISRRRFLFDAARASGAIAASVLLAEAAGRGLDLEEQHATWEEASLPNGVFLERHASRLQSLRLGGSFASEQWPLNGDGAAAARAGLATALDDLNLHEMRLGLRWSRVERRDGDVDLSDYAPLLDLCLERGASVCLNPGPIRVFRWPEEHVPRFVLDRLPEAPAPGSVIEASDRLAMTALDYLDRLLAALHSDYGPAAFPSLQLENEPFYPLGAHRWLMSPDYLARVASRLDAYSPRSRLLVTSAGRLNLHSIRDLFARLLAEERYAGRLISGFDFHYKTPLRDSLPVVRYFDQISYARPFAPGLEEHRQDARALGFEIEVSEGQAEPNDYLDSPGNSATDFRYMLLRCLDRVVDPEKPALIRIWGVERLAQRMLSGELSPEHRQIIDLIQTVNDTGLELGLAR